MLHLFKNSVKRIFDTYSGRPLILGVQIGFGVPCMHHKSQGALSSHPQYWKNSKNAQGAFQISKTIVEDASKSINQAIFNENRIFDTNSRRLLLRDILWL